MMTRLMWLLTGSLTKAKRAFREGQEANNMNRWPKACPYERGLQREQWLKGWRAAERSRRVAES